MAWQIVSPVLPGNLKSDQRIDFDLNELLEFEVGAQFMALLTYPKATESKQRHNVFLGLCAAYAAEQVRSTPTEATYLRVNRPKYFGVAPKHSRQALRLVRTSLKHRLLAALMARPFIGQALEGDNYALPPGLGELTPSTMAERISTIHNISPTENLMHRIWRPSLPVLHLAVGLENAKKRERTPAADDPHPDTDALVEPESEAFDTQDIARIREAIKLSVFAAEIIGQDSRIHIAPHELVGIRWSE